jgi:purine-cytosine permease-like protein
MQDIRMATLEGLSELCYSPSAASGSFYSVGDASASSLALTEAILKVLMALSAVANVAPTFYSFCLTFQVAAGFTARVPRYVFSIVATAV